MFILFWISSAVDLCKLLKDKLQDNELVMKVLFDKVSSGLLFYLICINLQFNVSKKHGYVVSETLSNCYVVLIIKYC